MSDWGGVHSGSKAALAGLDQQSAGEVFDAAVFFDEPLRLAVHGGVVPQARLNDMVARILRTMFLHGNFDNPPQHQKVDAEAGSPLPSARWKRAACCCAMRATCCRWPTA